MPWKFAEKLFFNKSSISRLILLEQGEKQDFFRRNVQGFLHKHFLGKNVPKQNLATIVHLPNITWVQNNLDFLPQIANLATNQDTTLYYLLLRMTDILPLNLRFKVGIPKLPSLPYPIIFSFQTFPRHSKLLVWWGVSHLSHLKPRHFPALPRTP